MNLSPWRCVPVGHRCGQCASVGPEPKNGRKSRLGPQLAKPVAIEFGDRLHQMVTGHEITREPRSVAYDEYTPTKRQFDRQLAIAYDEAQRALESYEVIATEYALECDFVVHLTEDLTVTVKTSCHVDLGIAQPSGIVEGAVGSQVVPPAAICGLAATGVEHCH